MNLGIDFTIVAIFLIATLFVGLGRSKGITNIRDYALGGRNFSTGALVSTVAATWITGSSFFTTLSKTYDSGLYYLIASSGGGLSLLLTGLVFVPKMKTFLGDTSIAESMGNRYGKRIQVITALTGTLQAIGIVAVQFKAFGTILGYFSNYSSSIAVIIAGCIVISYSASGGIKSVTFTDVLQFITFGFALPFVGIMIWNHLFYQDISVISALDNPKFDYKNVLNVDNPQFWSMLPLMIYFIIPAMDPPFCQRIIMGRDIKQVKKALIIAGLCMIFIRLTIAWISFLIFGTEPELKSNELLGYIIDNYTITGIKGLVIVGVIAMAMSTADSCINASSVLFANDICKPFKIYPKKELLLSRIFAVLLGVAAIFLALSTQDLLSMILTAKILYMPIITAPIMLTILGFKTTERCIFIGMFAGIVTVIFWNSLGIGADAIVMSILFNGIFMISSHYLLRQKGGWIRNNDKKISIQDRLITVYYKFKNIKFDFSLEKFEPKNDMGYVMLGVYFLLYTLTTIYSTQNILLKDQNDLTMVYIYQLMLITATIMTMYPIWPQSISVVIKRHIVRILWFASIIYMLVLINTFFVIASGFSRLQFTIFSMNLVITALLIGWKLSVVIIPVSFYLGMKWFYSLFKINNAGYGIIAPDFILTYAAIFTCIVLIIFLKPKQEHQKATEMKVGTLETEVNDLSDKVIHYSERVSDHEQEIERLGATAQKILNNVNHELRIPVSNVMNFADMLNKSLCECDKNQLKVLSDEFIKNSNRLSSMILNMLDLATLNAKKLELNKKTINLGVLVEERVKNCIKIYLEGKKIDFELKIHSEIFISVDSNYMQQVVDNLVINAIRFSNKGKITVQLLKKNNMVEFTITDNGIGIPKEEIYDVFTPFKMGSNTESKAEGRGVGLALCKAAIEAHNGSITAKSDGKNGATFTFTLSEGLHDIC